MLKANFQDPTEQPLVNRTSPYLLAVKTGTGTASEIEDSNNGSYQDGNSLILNIENAKVDSEREGSLGDSNDVAHRVSSEYLDKSSPNETETEGVMSRMYVTFNVTPTMIVEASVQPSLIRIIRRTQNFTAIRRVLAKQKRYWNLKST